MKHLDHPDKNDFTLCAVLDALADPIRLGYVRRMWREGECRCNSFVEPRAKSTRSHHFKVLRQAGVIMTMVRGTEFGLSLRKSELDERFPGLMDAILSSDEPAGKKAEKKNHSKK